TPCRSRGGPSPGRTAPGPPAAVARASVGGSVLVVVAGVLGALDRAGDLGLGVGAAHPVGTLDRLAGLEVLVDLEEVLDLQAVEVRDVVDVLAPRGALVTRRHAEHLVVAAGLVAHAEHAQRAALDQAAGEGRLLEQHERVERVAVLAERALDEAVVVGVARRGVEHAVEADASGLVIHLVLVPRTLGDLDRDAELHADVLQFSDVRAPAVPAPTCGTARAAVRPSSVPCERCHDPGLWSAPLCGFGIMRSVRGTRGTRAGAGEICADRGRGAGRRVCRD